MPENNSQSAFNGSCSPFFLTGIATSTVCGIINQVRALKMAKHDVEFDEKVAEIKEKFADYKADRDIAASVLKKKQKRQHKREEVKKELEKDLNVAELKMFLKDWPLVLDAYAILNDSINIETPALHFIVAPHKPYSDKDPLSLSYNNIVTLVKMNLRKMGISDDLVLTFKPKANHTGGPAIANCFALMQSIPTVMIMPSVSIDGKAIAYSIALWGQESRVPYCQKVFSFEYNKRKMIGDSDYKNETEQRIIKATTTIAAVYNDCYRIIEYNKEALLPKYIDSLSLNTESYLSDFALREYSSLTNPTDILHDYIEQNGAVDDSLSRDVLDSIEQLASAAVSALK